MRLFRRKEGIKKVNRSGAWITGHLIALRAQSSHILHVFRSQTGVLKRLLTIRDGGFGVAPEQLQNSGSHRANTYMLFAKWEVPITKNCDLGLENAFF